ncbi:SigE family RNA polymerase sigma factor [Micromonospora sp. IBHARD004]|uniref:SigE family RNA polymerase sigma factor n=1 Tax=Micromonospora sp. IBHARD004 TaxID=3457764 RepID=UPI004058BB7A
MTGDRWRAEELLQDSLVKVYERWRRLSRLDEPHAYLRRALVNNHTSGWRRRRRESLVADVPERAAPAGDVGPDAVVLRRALMSLPTKQRAVVVLRHYEDLTEREVAQLLGCSVGTVKSQNARALDKLRHFLDEPSYPVSR